MKKAPQSTRLLAILDLYDLHTPFFSSALAEISELDAVNRFGTQANHMAWLAGSLVHERFELANLLGLNNKPSDNELFANHKGIQEDVIYPSLDSLKRDWNKISSLLKEELLTVTDEALNQVIDLPGMSFPLYDLIIFQTYREANCIGQIALWRRLLGYDGMKYM